MKKPLMFAAVVAAMTLPAALTPATHFSDHCVLQRGMKLPVWGKADLGAIAYMANKGIFNRKESHRVDKFICRTTQTKKGKRNEQVHS